jgi:uncharacterized membrane protein YjgN (DUF898 family)
MNIEQEYQRASIAIDPIHYYLLWLKVTVLKILSLGLYAPWARQTLNGYLVSNTRFSEQTFFLSPHARNIFKGRLLFIALLFVAILLIQILPALTWIFLLLLLISLPGFYLREKQYELNAISLGDDAVDFKLSLTEFYKTITLPLFIFVLSAVVVFNSDIIDSRFLASIDTKDAPAIYAEDSYLALAEQEFKADSQKAGHGSDPTANKLEHADTHAGEIEQWNENISREEIEYLGEHEKSHNHGSIELSPLQKYQVANKGNQFIQAVLMFLLLCVLWPWMDYKMMAYRIINTTFLAGDWQMKLGVMSLYRVYVKTLLVVFALLVFIGLLLSKLLMGSEGSSPEFWSNLLANSLWLLPLGLAVLLFAFSLLFTWRKQWLLSGLASNTTQTKSESLYLETLLLSTTNTVLIFFTLGLALPWCHLRTTRYLTNHFNVSICAGVL